MNTVLRCDTFKIALYLKCTFFNQFISSDSKNIPPSANLNPDTATAPTQATALSQSPVPESIHSGFNTSSIVEALVRPSCLKPHHTSQSSHSPLVQTSKYPRPLQVSKPSNLHLGIPLFPRLKQVRQPRSIRSSYVSVKKDSLEKTTRKERDISTWRKI